jgi:hypothetical protein
LEKRLSKTVLEALLIVLSASVIMPAQATHMRGYSTQQRSDFLTVSTAPDR